jgi:hypothetical protein
MMAPMDTAIATIADQQASAHATAHAATAYLQARNGRDRLCFDDATAASAAAWQLREHYARIGAPILVKASYDAVWIWLEHDPSAAPLCSATTAQPHDR